MTVSFRARAGKKLLVATVGLATLTIGACDEMTTSGNLIAPPPEDMGVDLTVGNLIAPPPQDMGAAGDDAASGEDASTEDDASAER